MPADWTVAVLALRVAVLALSTPVLVWPLLSPRTQACMIWLLRLPNLWLSRMRKVVDLHVFIELLPILCPTSMFSPQHVYRIHMLELDR